MNVDPRFSKRSATTEVETERRERPKPSPKPQSGAVANAFATLLQIEGEMRAVPNEQALHYFICNEIVKLVPGSEAIFFSSKWRKSGFKPVAATGVSKPDANAPPMVALTESVTGWLAAANGADVLSTHEFSPKGDEKLQLSARQVALLRVFAPADPDVLLGVIVLLGPSGTEPAAKPILERLASAFGHSLSFFVQQKTRARRAIATRRNGLIATLLALGALAIPVPMSVLAPVEVVASNPSVVTAPFDGVVDSITVATNAIVEPGDLLVQFNDIEARSRLAIAESEARLAEARQRQIEQGAGLSGDMRREIAIVRAELDLARTELAEAQRQFARSQVRADVGGVAVFASREEWQGKPVATGERILEIADPERLELRIEVGMGDSVVLGEGATVRVFPDHDPFRAFAAQIESAAYRAEPVGEGRLAYIAKATFEGRDGVQLGQRGTARISNGTVSLGFYLFRRPIASIRQFTGL